MQPINRLLLILLAVGGLVLYWMKQQTRTEYERQVGALSSSLERRSFNPTTPPAQAEALFLRALIILEDYRTLVARGRIPSGEEAYLREAVIAAGYTSEGEIQLVIRNLRENLNLCQQMKVTGEGAGTKAMLSGQAPAIRAGSFKGESLVITRRIPAIIAPEAANHPGNYTLVPASVAALMWPYTLSDGVVSAVSEFKTLGLLDPRTAVDFKTRLDQLKALKP